MLKVKNLCFHLEKVILDNVSFEIENSQFFVLVGPSGSGKSSLAKALLNRLPSQKLQGEILYSPANPQSRICYVPQDPHSTLNPLFFIEEQIDSLLKLYNFDAKDGLAKVRSLFSLLGLTDEILKKYPHQLSGGMKQKVLILMAILGNPGLLIADEPTSSIDGNYKKEILELLVQIKNHFDTSIFLITHDIQIAEDYSEKIGVMFDSKIIDIGTYSEIIQRQKHPIIQELLSSRLSLKDRAGCNV